MKLSKLEQESIILYNEEESTASIYTHDPKLKRKLKRLAEKYPDKVYPDKAVHAGAVSYAVPKSCVSVREPFSDERRRAASERAKNAGYTPPARSIYSKMNKNRAPAQENPPLRGRCHFRGKQPMK